MRRTSLAVTVAVVVVTVVLLAHCNTAPEEDGTPPAELNAQECGEPSRLMPRAPDGDALCLDKEDCYESSGSPVGGCPNTCSCRCFRGVCYQDMCTAVGGCTEPPIYR